MGVYEVLLCFPDREELRLSDRALAVGEIVELDYRRWRVIEERGPVRRDAAGRFLLEPVGEEEGEG